MTTPFTKHPWAAALRLTVTALCFAGASLHAGDKNPIDAKVVETPAPDRWTFLLSMPGWLAATSGTVGVDGVNSKVYLSAENLLKHVDMIGSISAEARKGRFGIYGDFLYVSASDGVGSDGLVSKVDVRLDQTLADLEVNYRVLEGPRGWLDVRAGVRYTNVYNKVTLHPDDDAIDNASAELVDALADRLREGLSDLDLTGRLRGAIATRVSGRLEDLRPERRSFAVAPLGGRLPGRLDAVVERAIDRRRADFRAAVRAEAEATTDALRAAAQERIATLKDRLGNEIASALKSGLDQSASLNEWWLDPYVGLRARYNLGGAFYLTAKGDIGGFGIGSKLTWQLSGALGCQVSRSVSVEMGYRYLYTDYDANGFVYDVTQSGAQITAGIAF